MLSTCFCSCKERVADTLITSVSPCDNISNKDGSCLTVSVYRYTACRARTTPGWASFVCKRLVASLLTYPVHLILFEIFFQLVVAAVTCEIQTAWLLSLNNYSYFILAVSYLFFFCFFLQPFNEKGWSCAWWLAFNPLPRSLLWPHLWRYCRLHFSSIV